jgi:peptidoglycan hydrolase-like protein with peptidoglycan-binding domain
VDPSGVDGPPSVAPGMDDVPGASTLLGGGGGGGGGGEGEGAGRPGEERSSRRGRLRWLSAGALALVAAAVLAVVLLGSGSGGHHGAETGVPAGDTTASVTRRTLSESSTVDGTLGYGATLELYDRVGGTFTWLPSVGAVVGRGGTLWRIDDLPIVLMYGSVPAYRVLKEGVSDGPDVTQLNQNLIDLGFDPYGAITDEESFGAATVAAVKRWQKAEGLPETGEVELGRIVFASGARRVTDVKVTLGQDPPGARTPTGTPATPGAATPTGTTPATPTTANEPSVGKSPAKKGRHKSPRKGKAPSGREKGKPANQKPAKTAPSKAEPAKEKPAKEEPRKDSPSGESGKDSPSGESGKDSPGGESGKDSPGGESGKDSPGGGAGAGEVVLTTTSIQQIVQLKVKPEQQRLARVGETVAVQLPGGGLARGRVTQVGTVASESSGSGDEGKGSPGGESGESTIPVTITLDHHVAHLDEAPVSVELVKSVRRGVLTVPATALIATAGGGYAVEKLEGDRRATVPVTPGMFADGYVQVEGAGLREGLTVIESQ